MLEHFGNFSVFGESLAALLLILGVDLVLSAVHSLQEWKGKGGPLWRYFGAIAGLWIPDWLGFALFTVGLTVGLWGLAFVGMTGARLGCAGVSAAALGALIGARVSDSVVSHVMPAYSGYRPNPGLSSVPFYLVEALLLGVAFRKGLGVWPLWAIIGGVAGVLFFVAVMPLLKWLRNIIIAWRRDPWLSGLPIPQWVVLNS